MLPLAEKKNIELTTQIDPGLPIANQDADKLQQILYNLISNAVKFTPEGGASRSRPTSMGPIESIWVVADTGIGIPLDEQTVIFEKFRQGSATPGEQEGAMTASTRGRAWGCRL